MTEPDTQTSSDHDTAMRPIAEIENAHDVLVWFFKHQDQVKDLGEEIAAYYGLLFPVLCWVLGHKQDLPMDKVLAPIVDVMRAHVGDQDETGRVLMVTTNCKGVN